MKKFILIFFLFPIFGFCACGTQIGYSTVGGTQNTPLNGLAFAEGITVTNSGVVDSLNLYLSAFAGNIIMALYTNDPASPNGGAAPGTVLSLSTSQAAVTQWNICTLNNFVPVSASTIYWIAFEVSSSTSATQYDTATNLREYITQVYGTFPNNGTWTAPNNIRTSQYLTECLGIIFQPIIGVGR